MNGVVVRRMVAGAAILPLVLAWCSTPSRSEEPDGPQAALPLMRDPPKIDGRIDETEWNAAVRNVGFVSHATGRLCQREGEFWVGCDGQRLYVAVKTEAPPDGRILTRAVPVETGDQSGAFLDDSLELVLDPKRGRTAGDRRYYHLIFNARGALFDWSVDPDNRQNPVDLSWRLPDWQLGQSVLDGWWHVELAIPLASLDADADDLNGPWGIRVVRNWKRPAEQSQWEEGHPDYDQQASMPQIRWDRAAPVVRVLSLHQEYTKPRLEISLFNPHDQPLDVQVYLTDAWHRDPPQELRQRLTVPPHGQQPVVLESRDGGREGVHQAVIRVTSADGQRTFYERKFAWSLHRVQDRWSISEEQQQAVDLQFKFYPYVRQIRFHASVAALSVRDRIKGAEASIAPADERGQPAADPVWRQKVEFRDDIAAGIHEIPDLADGRYVFGLQLTGGEGVPPAPIRQSFVRRVFPWERNSLGISDQVMPPFTPLAVDGPAVSAVLRRHVHGSAGLWDAVTADDQPLLAGPMTWEVATADAQGNEQVCPVTGGGWRVTSAKPNSVSGQAAWSAGPLQAQTLAEYDYDGMLLMTLTLQPTQAAVRRLSLVVPLRDAAVPYLHAIGDGLRHNYAGFTPAGEGRIWDSSRASKLEIIGTFYPYLWLGDGERGLCWFADTDRDWVLDDTTPTVDLTRQAGTLYLRVHFITRPAVLTRPHRIVFGLQATPTKPMPDGWRRWTGSKPIPGARPVRWVGATYYWGGTSFDVYPYKYRFDFYDKLREARETGQADRQFIADWLAMVDRELAAKGTDQYKFYEAHVNAGFHSAASSRFQDGVRLFGYTNPRGIGFQAPEFATFQDEWLRYGWFNRNWGAGESVGYDVSPSRSFQDFSLWYYREMLRCFDGVYWDNMFLSAHFDPVVGQAWDDEQGRTHPTMGMMHLRELAKRTAVMLWQETKGRSESRLPPISLSHMTNTLLVPVHSFLNCTMDWEWKYGYDDFQDRFSPDFTVAETIGRQVGAWPTILAGGHPDPKDPRVDFLYRTRLGVALVHEIQVFDYQPQRDQEIYARLFEFGYGLDRCRVFNYWQPGYPVRVEGLDARTLAIRGDAGAIVVVTDYGAGGRGRVLVDSQKLGLPADAQAVDLETGQPVARDATGAFVVELKKHDFRILRIGVTDKRP
jgi:hypothetical protein